MAVNLKTATPDTTLPTAGFLFGADSQSASAPSVYPMSALISLLFGSTSFSGSAANTLVLSSGATAQNLHVYNTYTDASNYERGVFDWASSANVLTIGTANAGTGSARNLRFVIGGTNKLDYGVTNAGYWTFGAGLAINSALVSTSYATFSSTVGVNYGFAGVTLSSANMVGWASGANISSGIDTNLSRSAAGVIAAGNGTQGDFSATMKADKFIGKHQTDTAYVATPQTNTGYITMYDSTGTAYKVMVAT